VRYRVVKELNHWGERVQKSVFEIYIPDGYLEDMIERIKKYLEENDSFRIYRYRKGMNKYIGTAEFVYIPEKVIVK